MEKEHVVEKVVNYIELHLMDDLSLSKIAEALHYSKFYMERVFAENTGVTVYKYIQGRRLTIAARQLVESDRPITDIAYEAHYNSSQAFSLAFRSLYSCSPQTYRKNGNFYPKQTKISMCHSSCMVSAIDRYQKGRMAA